MARIAAFFGPALASAMACSEEEPAQAREAGLLTASSGGGAPAAGPETAPGSGDGADARRAPVALTRWGMAATTAAARGRAPVSEKFPSVQIAAFQARTMLWACRSPAARGASDEL